MSEQIASTRKIKIGLIGPLPPPVGGIRVSFQQLAHDLSHDPDIHIHVVEIPFSTGRLRQVLDTLRLLAQIALAVPQVDVMTLHATNQVTYTVGPIVWLLCKIFRKKSILRKFGGNFDKAYERMSGLQKWLLRHTTFRMDLILLQTNHLVEYFSPLMPDRVAWFPTSRPLKPEENKGIQLQETKPKSASRFVFVGHVKPTKGVLEIIEAANMWPHENGDSITVDVYGPLDDGVTSSIFADTVVNYCGALAPDKVIPTLKTYDALLLPTYHPGEGYPGVILEGYSAGIPVIASNWNAIPEIVDEESGILVQPHESVCLFQAMETMAQNPEMYAHWCKGAQQKARAFSSEIWSNRFVEFARRITAQ